MPTLPAKSGRLLALGALNAFSGVSLLAALSVFVTAFRQSQTANNDFTTYYLASFSLRHGLDLYQRSTLEAANQLVGLSDLIGPYLYPPLFAFLMTPLTLLTPTAARLLWAALSLGALIVGLGLLVSGSHQAISRWIWLPLATIIALFPPVFDDLLKGQITALLFLLIALSYFLLQRGKPFTAGTILGIASFIKLAPLLFVIYFAARRRWSALLGLLAAFAILGALSVVLTGPALHREYVTEVLPSIRLQYADPANASIVGVTSRLFTANSLIEPLWPNTALAITLAVMLSALIFGAALWAWLQAAHRNLPLEFALAVLAMVLLSPSSQTYFLTVVLIPLLLTLGWLSAQPRIDWHVVDGLMIALVLLAVPPEMKVRPELSGVLGPALENPPLWLAHLLAAATPVGLLLLFTLIWRLFMRPKASAPRVP